MDGQVALSQPAEYKDRSGWLLFFGIVQVLLGALSALMVPFMLLAAALSQGAPAGAAMRPRDIGVTLFLYVGLAVFFVWTGIGVIKLRRWARTLMLAFSWLWLIGGAFGLVFAVVVLPQALRQANTGPQPPPGLMAVLLTLMIGFMALIYVVLPLVFVLFYRSEHVRMTVEHRDPIARWTDRCPLPVLIASLMFASGGATLPLMAFLHPVLPFFGELVSGTVAAVMYIALGALFLYLAWAMYQLRAAGWWGALVIQGLWVVSSCLTFWKHDLLEVYERMDTSPAQLQAIRNMPLFQGHAFALWTVSFAVAYFSFLLFLRRYFSEGTQAA